MAKTDTVRTAAISATADGDNEVVAAPAAGKKIRVLGYVLNVNAAGTVQWKSGATVKSGAMEFVDGGGLVAPCVDPTGEVFWFDCGAAEALILTCAVGVDALGHLVYQIVNA